MRTLFPRHNLYYRPTCAIRHISFFKISIYTAYHKHSDSVPSNFQVMNWQNLYQKQLYENRELKKQLEVVESILRNFLPIIENDDGRAN